MDNSLILARIDVWDKNEMPIWGTTDNQEFLKIVGKMEAPLCRKGDEIIINNKTYFIKDICIGPGTRIKNFNISTDAGKLNPTNFQLVIIVE